jgi:PncC family amidohydrolase
MDESLLNKLREASLTVASAESCTGGLIASAFVDIAGASDVFTAGFVTYKEESKAALLGVSRETLDLYTAVSAQTAEEMCTNAARLAKADIGISSTGYAGPDGGTAENPVGTVYIGIYIGGKAHTRRLSLDGDRNTIRKKAVEEAFLFLRELI